MIKNLKLHWIEVFEDDYEPPALLGHLTEAWYDCVGSVIVYLGISNGDDVKSVREHFLNHGTVPLAKNIEDFKQLSCFQVAYNHSLHIER